jgi:hypothetical protein
MTAGPGRSGLPRNFEEQAVASAAAPNNAASDSADLRTGL